MKATTQRYTLWLLLFAVCGQVQTSQAIPIASDVLEYNGAFFELETEWLGDNYRITYSADFSGFQGASDASYLKAIDWKWEGGNIGSISLISAPGSVSDWSAKTFSQIGVGDSVQCQLGGGSNAVCTDFIANDQGFSTLTDTNLSWVFEVSFRNRNARQKDVLFDGGLRAAFVNGSGKLTAPIMSCSGAQNPGCPDPLQSPLVETQTLADDNGNVPIPGVPALLLAGLAGLFLSRRRGKGLRA
jgi:MYXO-CTERM domain-containing protein